MIVNPNSGNFSIGGKKNDEGYKVRVWGRVKAESFHTKKNRYPDYVFDHYYDGKSSLNDTYKFPSLEEVEKFTEKYHHLPGVTSDSDIKDGIDLSELSVQNLEKVEELYLHVIEMNKKLKELKKENKKLINENTDLNKRLSSEIQSTNKRFEKLYKEIRELSKLKK